MASKAKDPKPAAYCPFCGSDAATFRGQYGWVVRCTMSLCGASGPDCKTMETAVKSWDGWMSNSSTLKARTSQIRYDITKSEMDDTLGLMIGAIDPGLTLACCGLGASKPDEEKASRAMFRAVDALAKARRILCGGADQSGPGCFGG